MITVESDKNYEKLSYHPKIFNENILLVIQL